MAFRSIQLKAFDILEWITERNYKLEKFVLTKFPAQYFEHASNLKALDMPRYCAKKVPAYSKFLKSKGIDASDIKSYNDFIEELPFLDKDNYVKKYPFQQRCQDGDLPDIGIIEESAGSEGKPTNWIKSKKEAGPLQYAAMFEAEYTYHMKGKKYIIISCWSLGPWTADYTFCKFFENLGVIKNIGPNTDDVVETVKAFGPKYNYLIAGYPAFLKNLFHSTRDRIKWNKYKINILTGGDGYVPGWKEDVRKIIGKSSVIGSSYGASDIDIAIGFESPLASFVRETIIKDKKISEALRIDPELAPMIFQYNPFEHHINNIGDEFCVTQLNKDTAAPKVKYNIHDKGRKMSYYEMMEEISRIRPEFRREARKKGLMLKLPFIILYGRAGGVVSINGTNIYPQQVELAIFKSKKLTDITNTFRISDHYYHKHNIHFVVDIELKKGVKKKERMKKQFHAAITKGMSQISREFADSLHDYPESYNPIIQLFEFEKGLFQGSEQRVKPKYVEKMK